VLRTITLSKEGKDEAAFIVVRKKTRVAATLKKHRDSLRTVGIKPYEATRRVDFESDSALPAYL
jgi:hypothetical protein